MNEKRIYRRTPIELAASYGISEDLPMTQEASIINISSGGFGFFSIDPISAGTDLLLCVDLDDGTNVTLKVCTVWAKAVGDTGRFIIGVQITETEGLDLERFLNFYTNLAKNNLKKVI